MESRAAERAAASMPSSLIKTFVDWHWMMRIEALVGLDCWPGVVSDNGLPSLALKLRENPVENCRSESREKIHC